MVHGMVHMVLITNTGGFSIHNISIATFSPFSAGLLVVGKNMSKLFIHYYCEAHGRFLMEWKDFFSWMLWSLSYILYNITINQHIPLYSWTHFAKTHSNNGPSRELLCYKSLTMNKVRDILKLPWDIQMRLIRPAPVKDWEPDHRLGLLLHPV